MRIILKRLGKWILLAILALAPVCSAQQFIGALVNSGSGWTPWTATLSGGQSYPTPLQYALLCQATPGTAWQPCNPSSGGGSFTALTGDATSTSTGGATTVKGINGTLLSSLASCVLFNTTTTGVPSCATAAQAIAALGATPAINASAMTNFPTFNQNTTGNAATATNLASYPTLCSGGQFSQGLSSGSNNCGSPSGSGTVTSVSVTTANGVSGSVATATTTPAITLTLGAITPSSVASTGAVSGTSLSSSAPGGGVGSNVVLVQEGTVPSGFATAGEDNLYADSTQHGILSSFDAGAILPIVQGPASDTSGHLATWSGTNGGKLVDGGAVPTGTVTSVAVSSPLGGGPITTTGTLTCATCTTSAASITSNVLPKGSGGAQGIANSSVTDNGTTVTSTDTGGYVAPVFVANGTTAGYWFCAQGTTSAAAAPANSILFQCPTSVTAQIRNLATAPATGFSLWTNSSGTMTETLTGTQGSMSSGVGVLGTLAVNAVLASTVAAYAGHFTNLQVVTSLGGTCSTVPIFNVFDGATNTGSTVTATASTQTKGTGTSTAQTLTFAAGDVIGIYISTAGATCTLDQFIVTAQYSTP